MKADKNTKRIQKCNLALFLNQLGHALKSVRPHWFQTLLLLILADLSIHPESWGTTFSGKCYLIGPNYRIFMKDGRQENVSVAYEFLEYIKNLPAQLGTLTENQGKN